MKTVRSLADLHPFKGRVVDEDGIDVDIPDAPTVATPAPPAAPVVDHAPLVAAVQSLERAIATIAARGQPVDTAAILKAVAAMLPKPALPVVAPAPKGWDVRPVRDRAGRIERIVIKPLKD